MCSEQIILLDGSVPVLDELSEPNVEGVWITRDQFPRVKELRGWLRVEQCCVTCRRGIALIDFDNRVLWANRRLLEWVDQDENSAVGMGFYDLLGNPQIMGPDFSPFHTTMATGEESHSTLHAADNRYFQVNASTIEHPNQSQQLIITVHDITKEILQQQKLEAIHQTGRDLADLRPNEIFMMEVDERIEELLKENIQHYLSDLLNLRSLRFDFRACHRKFSAAISVGIDQDAADRQLYAHPQEME